MATKPKDTLHPTDPYAAIRAASNMSPEEKAFLAEVLPPERKLGKFVRGKLGGPGRPKGSHGVYNFRKLLAEYLERAGNHPEDIVAELFEDMMLQSAMGDVAASKFLLERLCGKENDQLDVSVSTVKLSDVERAARLQSILVTAAKRTEKKT